MSDAGPLLQPEGASDSSYVSQFRAHLAEVRAHLVGVVGDDPPPSFILPTGYWTPSEKNVFFHSLSVYSRCRPDLVAASIGTKSVVDVCAYIDILDEAVARDGHLLQPRSDLPTALEVSNAWVLREENMAEDIIPLETSWERDNLLFQLEEEISAKKTLKAEASTMEEGSVETLETWERDRRRCWSQEDVLSKLESHHLKVMEHILNDAGSGDADVEEIRPEDQEAEPMDKPPPGVKPSDRDSQSLVVSNEMNDPFLLHLLGIPVPDQLSIKGSASQRHPETSLHVEIPHTTLPALSATSSPQRTSLNPLVLQPLDYPRSLSPDGDKETGIDQSSLSPASRRRVQKRLHMRRRRAAQRGEDVNVATGKLRPGRKVQKPKASTSRGKPSTAEPELDVSERDRDAPIEIDQNGGGTDLSSNLKPSEDALQKGEIDENEVDDSDASRGHRRNNSGITKPYKIKRDFETKGIDSDTLIDGNLGFFHLSTLSRLMTVYKSGYDIKGSDAATSISADTIRLFSVILAEFVTEVVHRSITLREQENSMKAGIKVYHQTSDDITAENVTHVLEMMGMTGLNKEQYFAQLLGDDIPTPLETKQTEDESEADDKDDSEHSQEDEDVHNDDAPLLEKSRVFPFLLPLHREIHPPLVTLPKSLLPHAPARPRSPAPADDHLMPVETDEEELFEELDDEMDIDRTDQVLAHEHENNLWKVYGGR
ncbi:hypothetical protein C0995_010392 [Termitomyces sp. Mi166|nr:hypothetical protein C0995_010392 [Termitomyces sp. Mi166\